MAILRKITLIVAALVLLGSCGGGGGGGAAGGIGGGGGGGGAGGGGTSPPPDAFGFDTGVGGSGGVVGTFQGRGSIIVNDRRLTTTGADFELEGSPGAETDLKEGQQLIVVADLGASAAEHVFYRSNIKGPLTIVTPIDPLTGSGELLVLGQTVKVNSATRYSNVTLATLADGQLVEISGALDAAGVLVATFIEVDPAISEYKVVGTIANHDGNNRTFTLGVLNVDYSSALLSDFGSGAPDDGVVVEVKIAPPDFSAPASAVATEVERLPVLIIEDTAEVEFEGFVNNFVSATDFEIMGLPVTTNGATVFENGTADSLTDNVKVEAEGTVDASNVLVATKVVFKPTQAVRVEGTIAANGVDLTNATVTMAVGLTFQIRELTELEDGTGVVDPLTLADLAAGDYLEVRGFLDGQTLVAAELDRDDFRSRTRMRGLVTDENPTDGTVDILGITVDGTDGLTQFEDGAGNPISQAQFHALVQTGTVVEVEWDPFTSVTAIADKLSIENED